MKIAVTYELGNVFQHFGHTEAFKIYDVKDGKIVASAIVSTDGQGHGALAGFLKRFSVDTLICGGIGGGAQQALKEAGISVYGGVQGNADEAVKALLSGALNYDPNCECHHHDGEHSCNGEHHEENHSCHCHD